MSVRLVIERRAFASPTKQEELARVYLQPGNFDAPRADVDLAKALKSGPPVRVIVEAIQGLGRRA